MALALHKIAETAVFENNLPDREQLLQFARSILPQSERNGTDLAVLTIALETPANGYVDVEQVTSRIRGCIRAGDYLAMLQAREFVVVLTGGCGPLAANAVAQRISAALAKPAALGGTSGLNCAIGITSTRDDMLDMDRILSNSATAVDRARETQPFGRSVGIQHFSKSDQSHVDRHILVADELECAFDNDQIIPWFQPQISFATNELTGFEALVRWNHPERGILSPAAFLDIAEQTGQTERLGEIVLRKSLLALKQWQKAGVMVPRVSVNLSPKQLSNPKLAQLIHWELDRNDVDPSRLNEVLESVLGSNGNNVVQRNLQALKSIGVMIDLDDFGTGNASIVNIRRFGVHRIKIDRSFIGGLENSEDQQKIIAAMVTMANALGVQTLAEGVETPAEELVLRKLGCNYLQGYCLAKPMPAQEVIGFATAYREKRESA